MQKGDSRAQIREFLQRALDDVQFRPSKLDGLMDEYPFLGRAERVALVHLSNWEADESLRRLSPKFADYSRKRLTNLIDTLD